MNEFRFTVQEKHNTVLDMNAIEIEEEMGLYCFP